MPEPTGEQSPAVTILFNDFSQVNALLNDDSATAVGPYRLEGIMPGMDLQDATSESGVHFAVTRDDQRFKCFGIAAPAPGLDEVIQATRADNALFEGLQAHTAHILCFAEDENDADGLAQTLLLMELATTMKDHGAQGVIHTSGEQCFTIEQLDGIVPAFKEEPEAAKYAFINVRPLWSEGCTYYVTRGAPVFGARNICLFDPSNSWKMPDVNNMIYSIVDHMRGGVVIKEGDKVTVPPVTLKAVPVNKEFEDYIRAGKDDDILQLQPEDEQGASSEMPSGAFGVHCAFLMIARSEGRVRNKEIYAYGDCLRRLREHKVIGEIFEAARLTLRQTLEKLLDAPDQGYFDILKGESAAVATDRGPEAHRAYQECVFDMAEQVASATGGFFGFGNKVSKEEKATLEHLKRALGM